MTDPDRVTVIFADGSANEFDTGRCTLDEDAHSGVMLSIDREAWYNADSIGNPAEVVATGDETRVFAAHSTAYGTPYVTITAKEL